MKRLSEPAARRRLRFHKNEPAGLAVRGPETPCWPARQRVDVGPGAGVHDRTGVIATTRSRLPEPCRWANYAAS